MSVIDDIKDKVSGKNSSGSGLEKSLGDSSDSGGLDLGDSGNSASPGRSQNHGNPPPGSNNHNSPPSGGSSPGNLGNGQRNQKGPNGGKANLNSPQSLGQNQPSPSGTSSSQPPSSPNSANSGHQAPERSNNSGSPTKQRAHGSGKPSDSPNPQTGRPQPGASSPQVSQETERKMQKMMKEGEPDSVSTQRSDFEDLKAQNKQIIDLLKRINQNLSNI